MPYEIRRDGNQYCIHNQTTGAKVKGSCKSSRAACIPQLRALYANVPDARRTDMAKSMNEKAATIVPVKAFAEALAKAPVDDPIWIQYSPFGKWSHPMFGTTTMTVDKAEKIVKNFKDNVRQQDLITDYEHGLDPNKGGKASGQIVDFDIRPDGLYSAVKFTDTAREEIAAGEWRYFSPEFFETWVNPMDDSVHEAVAAGGGLTNKPWIKGMVPINFSEVVLEREYLRGKKNSTGDWVVSEDGSSWRKPTTDEVAELEHSDPGTGSPPAPRPNEDDISGDKDGSGSRRDTPPNPDVTDSTDEEGRIVKLSKEAAEALGLTFDAEGNLDEDAVDKAVLKMFSEYIPLRDAEAAKSREKTMAQQFPEEYAELMAQRESRLDNEAKQFSEQYARLHKTEGEGDEAKTVLLDKGLSALALEKVQKTHKLFSQGNVADGMKSFSEMMVTITGEAGIVDYSEHGSSRTGDEDNDTIPTKRLEVAKAFSEKVAAVQKEAGGPDKMSWGDALAKAAVENPALAKAYQDSQLPQES